MKVPYPPSGSSFVVDIDEQGLPRLSWSLRPNYLGAVLASAVFGCWLYYAVGQLVQYLPEAKRFSMHFFGSLTYAFFLGTLFIILVYVVGRTLIYGPTPHWITFGPEMLYFEPRLFSRQQIRGVKQVSRSELGAIRLQLLARRQFLTIDRGVERLEVASGMTDEDLAWLAEVLGAWATQQQKGFSDKPAPPDDS